jgi:ribonucleoside-diphosphate reductase alpha chain
MTTLAPEMTDLGETIFRQKYSLDGKEEWHDTARRVVEAVMGNTFPELVEEMIQAVTDLKFLPGGRYLYASGKPFAQTQNCLLCKAEDSREGWADFIRRGITGLMTGAGIGGVYTAIRSRGTRTKGMGGVATGPVSLAQMLNENGRHIMQGGSRRAALWAGLHWHHPDVFEFIHVKDWSDEVKALKEKDPNFPAPMDMTNISVILDDDFFTALEDPAFEKTYPNGDSGETYTVTHDWAHKVYWEVIEQMLTTGEPGFSVDVGENAGEHLRNACTEVTSADDDDICNLGSINLARIEDQDEMDRMVFLGTAFLLSGTTYSEVPYAEVAETRVKNRRLGLGLMGVYEWLAVRGKPYAPDEELGQWMKIYTRSTRYANLLADRLGISRPVKTRAIAPNGTIAILAGTTSSIEPLFALAIIRKWITNGTVWSSKYVIDSIAERLVAKGLDPSKLETAYDLAKDPERRVLFQAWMQQYVDHGISSTINLPGPEEHEFTHREFGEMLLKYLPHLRGITAYPNGARGGQPLTAVSYEEAARALGVEFEETSNEKACLSGVCGI